MTFLKVAPWITISVISLLLMVTSCGDETSVTAPETGDDETEEPVIVTTSITAEPDTLIESQEMEGILTIELSEELPHDSLKIPISVRASDGSSKPLARFKIAEFDPSADIEGAELDGQIDPNTLDRFVLRMTDQTAKVSFTTNDDSFDDGPLDVTFSIEESELFDLDEEQSSASFTILETAESSELTTFISVDPDTLIESAEMEGVITIELSEELPHDSLRVPVSVSASDGSSKPLARFKIASFNTSEDIEGAELEGQIPSTLDRFVLRMTDQTAKIFLTVNDDSFDSGPLDVTFTLGESDLYIRDEEQSSASFTILENEEETD